LVAIDSTRFRRPLCKLESPELLQAHDQTAPIFTAAAHLINFAHFHPRWRAVVDVGENLWSETQGAEIPW
jgi:hypothetical protein